MIPYSKLAKKAKDEVRDLEEPYKSIAYQTILRDLINRSTSSKTPEVVAKPRPEGIPENPVELFLTSQVNATPYVGLLGAPGKLLEKSLAVLKLARDELQIDGLTAPQVTEILVKKFRVARVHSANVSRDMGNATRYVTRLITDGEYRYLLMTAGEQYLEEIAQRFR